VMAMEPQVLVLDEPTAGLDPAGKEQILNMIRHYRTETHCTVILISHNMDEVARMADHVLVMHNGHAALFGTVPEVFCQEAALRDMGLTVPVITKIFNRLRERGLPISANVFTAEQAAQELLRLKGGTPA